MIEDVGTAFEDMSKRIEIAPKIGSQYFDGRPGYRGLDCPNGGVEVSCAAIRKIIAGNGGDDNMPKPKFGGGRGNPTRFFGVQGAQASGAHAAKPTIARADFAHDHEGCGSLAIAFTAIGAFGFHTNCGEAILLQDFFDNALIAARRNGSSKPLGERWSPDRIDT